MCLHWYQSHCDCVWRPHHTGQVCTRLQSSGGLGEYPWVPDVPLARKILDLFITERSWLSRAINSVRLSVIASAFGLSLINFLLKRYFLGGGKADCSFVFLKSLWRGRLFRCLIRYVVLKFTAFFLPFRSLQSFCLPLKL